MNPESFDPATEPYVSLATFRNNGNAVLTPVWIAGRGSCYYVFSAAEAGKVKRIRANGRARLAACSFRGNVQSDWLEARARILDEPENIARAYRALYEKYGWKMRVTDWLSKLSGRYEKRAILEIQLADTRTQRPESKLRPA
ncbi:MAG: PPOX class F420-dependent oxidoreductase [Porticoccaceae bacterium]